MAFYLPGISQVISEEIAIYAGYLLRAPSHNQVHFSASLPEGRFSFVPPKSCVSVIYKCSSDHLPVQITASVLSVNCVFPLFILASARDWMPETCMNREKSE